MSKRPHKAMSKHTDDLTEEEIKDIKEYYTSNDRKIVTAKELLDELHKQ
jgi:cytochrome c553